ncbi:MAG TPA: NAD-binding protein [Coleofasciculaceae cyanobacterium]|jgi:trk system potassium uptake protein TrkA
MYLIIVGGGAVTKQLIAVAQGQGHKIAVIEKKAERAGEIMQKFNVSIFQADIATGGILDEANVDRADAIIATTNDDSVNLMAMI